MALKKAESMEELVYFTSRNIGEGEATVWVFKQKCDKCKKSIMGKPVDKKTGKVKTRATVYTCNSCDNTVEKEEYEDTLTANITYCCPECKKEGEIQTPFKRKRMKGADTLRFQCESCNANIDVTKKMKGAK